MADVWSDKIYALWDEMVDRAATDVADAAHNLMVNVSGWIHADRAAWIGSVRLKNGPHATHDAMFGWRGRVMVTDRPPAIDELKIIRRWLAHAVQATKPGMDTVEVVRGSGQFRVHQLRDGFVNFAEHEQTEHYDIYYRQIKVHDRIWVAAPVSSDAEVVYFFDRRGDQASKFTAEEVQLAGQAFRGLTWFHRQLLIGHGLLAAQTPLTPTERRVLSQLLTPKSELDIAAKLRQSRHTTHDHVRNIYKKLGVNSRTALMAVWLHTS